MINLIAMALLLSLAIPISFFISKDKIVAKEIKGKEKLFFIINKLLQAIFVSLCIYYFFINQKILLLLSNTLIYFVTVISFYKQLFNNENNYLIDAISTSLFYPLVNVFGLQNLFPLFFVKNYLHGTLIAIKKKDAVYPTIFYLVYSILAIVNSQFLGNDIFLSIAFLLTMF